MLTKKKQTSRPRARLRNLDATLVKLWDNVKLPTVTRAVKDDNGVVHLYGLDDSYIGMIGEIEFNSMVKKAAELSNGEK